MDTDRIIRCKAGTNSGASVRTPEKEATLPSLCRCPASEMDLTGNMYATSVKWFWQEHVTWLLLCDFTSRDQPYVYLAETCHVTKCYMILAGTCPVTSVTCIWWEHVTWLELRVLTSRSCPLAFFSLFRPASHFFSLSLFLSFSFNLDLCLFFYLFFVSVSVSSLSLSLCLCYFLSPYFSLYIYILILSAIRVIASHAGQIGAVGEHTPCTRTRKAKQKMKQRARSTRWW